MKIKEKEKDKEDTTAAAAGSQSVKVLYDNRIKRKNVLALNEKVAAIREYEKMPVYKRVGRMFHCSPDQIKRIVQQKDSILRAWEQRTRRCQDAKTLEMKVVRVSMLGKAVYDWIRRMMYYKDLMITDGLIQKMALQFKSAMGLQNFFPHQDWCDKFRQTYNITENDSRQLKIGYVQGHSVQIKDVMKDVLSECTPDVISETIDDDDDEEENDRDGRDSQKTTATPVTTSNTTVSTPTPIIPSRSLPTQLQPIRQLVALPFKSNGVPGMTQKVLVATPIRPAGQMSVGAGAPPMTMTIIPLTTIAQPKSHNSQGGGGGGEKQLVPPPMNIKQEIKEEPADPPQVNIKQECISDDEDEEASTANSPKTNTEKNDATDYDNLALASLRKIIQNQGATTETTSPATSPPPPSATPPTSPPRPMPPLPPLTKAPTPIAPTINRMANKRKINSDSPPLPAIKTCSEARKYLKLLEDFALVRENFRLIGLITRADEVMRELDGDEDVDVD